MSGEELIARCIAEGGAVTHVLLKGWPASASRDASGHRRVIERAIESLLERKAEDAESFPGDGVKRRLN